MNSQILIKINSFTKKRLIELSGLILILIGLYLFISIISYSPADPNFIYKPDEEKINNVAGFYGSVVSDFLLQAFGLISFLFIFNFISWGYKLIVQKKISSFIAKYFYVVIYTIFGTFVLNVLYNDSFSLMKNGNGGFVGRLIKENIYYFSSFVEKEYITYSFALLTIIFFIFSLGIQIKQILKILIFPYTSSKIVFSFFKREKTNRSTQVDTHSLALEVDEFEPLKQKQPILPFSKKKMTYIHLVILNYLCLTFY